MEEVWKDIVGYEGLYAVSNKGRVKGLERLNSLGRRVNERILIPRRTEKGYLYVYLCREGSYKKYRVHRLVLSTFNPCPDSESLQVNHINELKDDNRLENLEWCTCKENINHGTRNDRAAEKLRGRTLSDETRKKISENNGSRRPEVRKKMSIPIVQLDPYTNKVINVWGSGTAAARQGGYNHGNISLCCNNKYLREGNNIYKGYKWQYLSYYISQIDPRIKKVILFGKEYVF